MKAVSNRICQLFSISYPIIQGGMVWCSGWRLASAVSQAGGLGLIGSGSMTPDLLREHILKAKAATNKPFGVNIPLLYKHTEDIIRVVTEEGVRIIFTSAGNPKQWTQHLKQQGCTVAHVVSSLKFAIKAEESGVDAIVVEGVEAGGHNGREETTTMVLLQTVCPKIAVPVIAAGGIGSGRAILAAEVLGAEGFQLGTVFATSEESSAHTLFKNRVIHSAEGDTILTLKKLNPVRILKNAFYDRIKKAEDQGAVSADFTALLGKGRSRMGIFEGDLDEGELEIGQISSMIESSKPAKVIMEGLIAEYQLARENFRDKTLYWA